ncbi:MAG: DEAD/DEAH box helicase family protein [Deltaproteobacteria bacterium]|nr:DEAD/DEAH box helicase family protein [Deltaproteobacteria bacterium]
MALLPPDGSPIGNATLYRKLRPQGWSKDDFARVRAALVAEGRVAKGKGRGGSIRRLGGPQLDLIAEAPVTRDPAIEALAVDVAAMVRDRGRLTRQEILDFGIPDALYPAVQKAVLAAALDVEKVPNKNGGLAVRERGGADDGTQEDVAAVHLDAWEEVTVQKLCGWFKREQLEVFVGTSVKHQLRSQRTYRTRVDRKSQSKELAIALITAYGTDLLKQKRDLRDAIAKLVKIERVEKWVPGRAGAREFVALAGLPLELAGEPNAERPADSEIIERPIQLAPLADFQNEVKAKLTDIFAGRDRALASLPTGAGKTRTAVESIREYLTRLRKDRGVSKHTVLWLAHTEELCEQAFLAFRDCWQSAADSCSLFLCRFWGAYSTNLEKYRTNFTETKTMPSVLVSTPQRIVNLLDNASPVAKTAAAELEQSLAIVVVDEAHRAGAPSYKRIIEHFAGATSMVAVVGLTATPFSRVFDRKNPQQHTEQLATIFEQLIVPTTSLGPLDGSITTHREVLQQRGYLARTESRTVQTQQRVTAAAFPTEQIAKVAAGASSEFLDRAIAQRVDRVARRMKIADEILAILRSEDPKASVLYFGPSVVDAQLMAMLLREQKLRAAFVSGETRMAVRRRLINEFRAGSLQVLCNCEVLTTGFDAPRVTHIVMGRPTVSIVLYEQIVGRGLRGAKFGGTETCVIVDCVDDYRGIQPIRLAHEDFRRIWESRAYELV